MNSSTRTPQPADGGEPVRRPLPTTAGTDADDWADETEARRVAAAHALSGADHRSRADAALGEADAARGSAAEFEASGDLGAAAAAWSDAAGLDGVAAQETTTADVEARAAAATATSTTVPAPARGARKGGPAPTTGQGRGGPAPAPAASPPRRVQ